MPELLKDFVLSVKNEYRKRRGQPDPIDNEEGLLSSDEIQQNVYKSRLKSVVTKMKITSRTETTESRPKVNCYRCIDI